MQDERDRIRPIKEAVEDELLARPGVTGVDLGLKWTRGRATERVAIRVYVEQKGAQAGIPAEIRGVPTDVIERRFELHADTGLYDPLLGGISVGSARKIGGRFTVGTLASCVKDTQTDRIHLLGTYHVLAGDAAWTTADETLQPAGTDGGTGPVARLTRAVLDDHVDAAIAEVTVRRLVPGVVEIGPIAGVGRAAVGKKVQKRGRTTGLTLGLVDSVDLSLRLPTPSGARVFRNQIGVAVAPGYSARFGLAGDSGALLVDGEGNAVGLYIGGTPDGTYGVANHIGKVLSALAVRLCKAAPKSKVEKQEKGEAKLEKPEKWEKLEGKWEAKEKPEKGEGKEKPEKWEKREGLEKGAITPEEHTKWEIDTWKLRHGKEPGKEVEGKVGFDFPPLPPPPEPRLDQLEREVARLRHFIDTSLRPNLEKAALLDEPDLPKKGGDDD